MSDFAGMEDLLQDFLVEATDLLSGVDNKLVDLEKNPQDHGLLNDIFRGFHTIKGGAGFLNAAELVTLCHLTENLFDKLRTGELVLTKEIMDSIMAATGTVRDMFGHLESGMQPPGRCRFDRQPQGSIGGRDARCSYSRAACSPRCCAGCRGTCCRSGGWPGLGQAVWRPFWCASHCCWSACSV